MRRSTHPVINAELINSKSQRISDWFDDIDENSRNVGLEPDAAWLSSYGELCYLVAFHQPKEVGSKSQSGFLWQKNMRHQQVSERQHFPSTSIDDQGENGLESRSNSSSSSAMQCNENTGRRVLPLWIHSFSLSLSNSIHSTATKRMFMYI